MENLHGFQEITEKEVLGSAGTWYYMAEQKLAVVPLTEQLADKLCINRETTLLSKERAQGMLKETGSDYLLMVWKEQENICLFFISSSKRIRSLEILDYLVSEFGLVRGDAFQAQGRVPALILKMKTAESDITDTLEYFFIMIHSYFSDCDWIEAAEYGEKMKQEILEMPVYAKKKISWAYVKTTDAVPAGKQIRIRSLENESGLELTADDDTYIMVGCRGEVYDIRREKFEKTYEPTSEPLDVFTKMLDFLPELVTLPEEEYLPLDEIAHLCYPQKGAGIYCKKLTKRTKVFPTDQSQEYFLGRPGDYLAVRPDDLCDIYIIQEEIFNQTYEPFISE